MLPDVPGTEICRHVRSKSELASLPIIMLTAKEFDLLQALMGRSGRVLTRERLLQEVWGSDIAVTVRSIDTHLKRLREKLGRAGALIETVRGVGYRFSE